MPALALLASAAGGRFVPDTPVLTHVGAGVFTITNYNASYTYVLSNGAATRNGASITLPSTSMSTTLTVYGPKGVVASTSRYLERKPLAYTPVYSTVERRGECGPGPDCSCHPGFGPAWDTDPVLGSVNPHCERTTWHGGVLIDEPGYTNSNGEWIKNQ